MQFQAIPVLQPHALVCPSCKSPVLWAHANAFEVPGGETWLRDGDTIGGLHHELTPDQQEPSAHLYMLEVGGCRACGKDYYVVEAVFMDAQWEQVKEYLYHNVELGPSANFVCVSSDPQEGFPSQWLLTLHATDVGARHAHVFGPWSLESDEGVVGPYGVSSCGSHAAADPWRHAANVLLHHWDAMRLRCLNAPPQP